MASSVTCATSAGTYITGTSPGINYTSANNHLLIEERGFVMGNVNGGGGDDCFELHDQAAISGDVIFAEGDDTIRLSDDTYIGSADFGDGANSLLMTGTSEIGRTVTFGSGNDVVNLTNSVMIGGNITMGAGDDEITLSNKVSVADIMMDDGSDILTINGSGVALGDVLDGGDDVSSQDGFVDTLIFNNWAGNTPQMDNWEVIQLNNSGMALAPNSNIETENFILNSSVLTAEGGMHNITGNVENYGTIDMSDNDTSGNFIIGGNYIGTGALNLDVDLANQQSDTLTVGGDVNAQGTIDFNRVGSDSSAANPQILVISAPNDDQATVSSFSFDATVGGSAYTWAMTNKAGDGFYLGFYTGENPDDPDNPDNPDIPSQDVRVLPAIAAYADLPTIGRELALSEVSTLHDRLGELRRLDGWIGSGPQNIQTIMGKEWSNQMTYIPQSWNIWAKGIIAGLDIDGNESYQLDGTYGGFDIGLDRKFTTRYDDFIIYGGLFGGYRTGDFSTDGTSERYYDGLTGADIDVHSWSIGAYATLFWNNTTYLDLVANYSSLNADISNDDYNINQYTTLAAFNDDVDGDAFALSAEIGHRIDLAKSWILEPEAQLTYSSVRWDDSHNDTYDVNYENGNYFTARAGLRIEKTFKINGDSEFKPWFRANILQEFGDDVTVDINNESFDSYDFGTYAQFDLGTTYVIKENIQLYGNGTYRSDFSDYDAYEIGGGLRISW